MTSSRSSAVGATFAFTMPLVPLALHCFKVNDYNGYSKSSVKVNEVQRSTTHDYT
jgi:hypothetical protein